jgi:LmbE family N-acetylglucosaminyl deacetylase
MPATPTFTIVSFHAHPDDESLFTGGTLARAAAEGHRVILVVATDGAAGLSAAGGDDLGARRADELRLAAAALGVNDVRHLGFGDSGMGAPGRGATFARADVDAAAETLAAILDSEAADALTIYDPSGGYGHPDHVQVHRVGSRAAALAGTKLVLEATVDRRPLMRALRLVERSGFGRRLGVDPAEWSAGRFATAYSNPGDITHKVDVRPFAGHKRRAMAAHATQAGGAGGTRTLAALGRLPGPVFERVLGYEWFVEHGRAPATPPLDDIFASLRD